MNKMTKTTLKGKSFYALAFAVQGCIEDIPFMRKELQKQIEGVPEAILTETEDAFELNNGQFFRKPVIHNITDDIIVFGKNSITFGRCRIEYKNIAVHGNDCIESDSFLIRLGHEKEAAK